MKKILVPIDLSENSINALKYANSFATEQQSSIILLNIYTGDISNYEAGWPIEESIDNIKPERIELINTITNANCTVPTSVEIIEGEVVDTIVSFSKNNEVDLIIMGTHGASGIKAVLMGSNTSNVVAQSDIPVLAIPIGLGYTKTNKIIYASDFEDVETELQRIITIANSIHANVEVLHLSYDNHNFEKNEMLFNEIVSKNKSEIQISLKQNLVGMEEPLTEQLKAYLATQDNSLLAMFTQERDWFGKLFLSSKTEELANDLELPLLSLRKS